MLTILRHDVEHRRGGPAGVWPDGTLAKYALILVEAIMPAAGLGQVDASQIAAINRCAMSYGGLLRDDALSSGNATLSKYDVSLFCATQTTSQMAQGGKWRGARGEPSASFALMSAPLAFYRRRLFWGCRLNCGFLGGDLGLLCWLHDLSHHDGLVGLVFWSCT
jgi:hypothetical protein